MCWRYARHFHIDYLIKSLLSPQIPCKVVISIPVLRNGKSVEKIIIIEVNAWYISLDITTTSVQGGPLIPVCRTHHMHPFLSPSKILSTSQALTPPSQPPPSSLLSTGNNWVLLYSTPVSLGEMGLSQHILKLAWWTAANCLGEMLSFQGTWVPPADFTPSQCSQCLSLRFFWCSHRGEGRRMARMSGGR